MRRGDLALVAVFALATAPAKAHCYSLWRYPRPQLCRVTSAAPVHHRTWFVDVAPEPTATPPTPAPAPVVEAPVSPEAIETLNEELRWRAANSLTLEEKRNGD